MAERIVHGSKFAGAMSVGPNDQPSEGSSETQGGDDNCSQDRPAERGSFGACGLEFYLCSVELSYAGDWVTTVC